MAANQGREKSSKEQRGFAAMDEQKQRAIASKGGHAAHAKGTAHEFDSAEARKAGQKGGEEVSSNREHMAEIGRKGAESRAARVEQERSRPVNKNTRGRE
jgi:general stress protein YciG